MNPLDMVGLNQLMQITEGIPEIRIGLVDGPIAIDHPDLVRENLHQINSNSSVVCAMSNSLACLHGTLVAGVMAARRNTSAPAICPGCTFLLRPIFLETTHSPAQPPSATPDELAAALFDCVSSGARVINLSAAMAQPRMTGQPQLEEALNYASSRGVIIVAAAGNQATVGSTLITRHPWVIPVVAVDLHSKPLSYSNLGSSISHHGLSAPGENISSLGANARPALFHGTSAATPFVTGAVSLLLSLFPKATAVDVRLAVIRSSSPRRRSIVPPLLDAWAAYLDLHTNFSRRLN
jgi:subtilisin family serine protease